MNFIFVSPHFPKTYWNFCDRLHRNGVNVLGIGDAPFEEIPSELRHCLTEYYRVGDYSRALRAVGYFTFHYGKIDWLESNNEYWLEMDAQLRTDFNITTGAQNDFIARIKFKSRMKEGYRAAGVPVARHHMVSTLDAARDFIREGRLPGYRQAGQRLRRRGHLQTAGRNRPAGLLRRTAFCALYHGRIYQRDHRQL